MSRSPVCPSRRAALALLALSSAGLGTGARAQAADPVPARPISWLVGYPPGGSVDVLTRLVARRLEVRLGQSIVVENRPGATGALALRAAAGAAPDGHTLVTVPGPVLSNTPTPQIGRELAPVSLLATGATILVGPARPDAPKDLKSLLADLRARPDTYSYATSGNGTAQHLIGELINATARTSMTHVPYKGGGQAVSDVVGGQVPLAVLGITPVLPHVRSGRLIAYGVSTASRSPSLPDVPSLREGGLADFDASQWFVVAAPKGLAPERAERLHAAIALVLKDPDVVAGCEGLGLVAQAATPQQTGAFVAADLKRWNELAQKAKLSLE